MSSSTPKFLEAGNMSQRPPMAVQTPVNDDSSPFWWRSFIFGDYHSDTHHFIESAFSRAPKEVACALTASLAVSPLVSIIDKCMVQEISGTKHFLNAISSATREMVVTPRKFFGGLSFQLTVAVYFGTYAVANLAELALDTSKVLEDDKRKNIKVAAASVANIGLLSWRDTVFAREFSSSTHVRRTPLRTLGLFAARDASTMYATFYLAPMAAEYLQEEYDVERNVAELSTALAIPVVTQFVTAPFHIHAMDIYNKPVASVSERIGTIRTEFNTIAFARGLRILPAFGIGSFSNNKLREMFIRQPNEELLLKRRVSAYIPGPADIRLATSPKQ